MPDQANPDVIRLLVGDALEASNNSSAHAATLLMEAAMSVVMSRFSGAAAREAATMLTAGMVMTVNEVTGGAA